MQNVKVQNSSLNLKISDVHFIQCQKTTDIYRKKKLKYKPYHLCCVRYTYDESRLETKRFENCMFCISQDSRTILKSNEYIKALLLMSTTDKVLHTDEPKMINTTHLFGKIYHKLLSTIINRAKKE